MDPNVYVPLLSALGGAVIGSAATVLYGLAGAQRVDRDLRHGGQLGVAYCDDGDA